MIQVLQDVMQCHVNCIVHLSVCPVDKLQGIQQMACEELQAGQHQAFKGLHNYRCQNNRSVVIQSSDDRFLGDRNDGGTFAAGENFTQLKRSVE